MPKTPRADFQEPTAPVQMLVGDDRVALVSTLRDIRRHCHAAPAVVVGADGPLRFIGKRTYSSRAALVAPGFDHAVDVGGGRIAVFLLPTAAASLEAGPIHDLGRPGEWVEIAHALGSGRLTSFEPIDHCLERAGVRPRPIDQRLERSLAVLTRDLASNVAIEELAMEAGLSPTRLMTLARELLGSSLRRYRRWLRAFRVARAYATGVSLTRAALEAGYSSSAHLSAAVREQFGIRPSELLSPGTRSSIRAV